MKRNWIVGVITGAFVAGSVAIAPTASAVTSVTFTAGGTLEIGGVAAASGTNINDTTISFTNDYASDVTFITSGLSSGGTACNTSPSTCQVSASGGTITLTAPGAANAIIYDYNGGNPTSLGVRFTVNSGSGGTTASLTSLPTFALTFDAGSGAQCEVASVLGVVGSWVSLPTAAQCTRANSVLLGWATTQDFPLEIARRQIENGWGAYQEQNASGAITSIFIPAGRSAAIAAPDRLYAVWG